MLALLKIVLNVIGPYRCLCIKYDWIWTNQYVDGVFATLGQVVFVIVVCCVLGATKYVGQIVVGLEWFFTDSVLYVQLLAVGGGCQSAYCVAGKCLREYQCLEPVATAVLFLIGYAVGYILKNVV